MLLSSKGLAGGRETDLDDRLRCGGNDSVESRFCQEG